MSRRAPSSVASARRIEIEPASSFVIGAGAIQPLFAVVQGQGSAVKEEEIAWHVEPPGAGEILCNEEGARIVAGRFPMTAKIYAEHHGLVSKKTEVHIWPATGLRMGFRPLGGEFPVVLPPGPRAVRRR
jgi:hypothetical protein